MIWRATDSCLPFKNVFQQYRSRESNPPCRWCFISQEIEQSRHSSGQFASYWFCHNHAYRPVHLQTSDLVTLLLLFSCLVLSDSLWPHELQHASLPCPSLSPRACSNSWPLSRWCHPTIASSVIPFSSCLQSFPASGSFPMSQLFSSGGQSIGASVSASVLPMNVQGWFRLPVWFHSSQYVNWNLDELCKGVIEGLTEAKKLQHLSDIWVHTIWYLWSWWQMPIWVRLVCTSCMYKLPAFHAILAIQISFLYISLYSLWWCLAF